MKILYICDKLSTFILNEIIELKKNNDILILSEHSKPAYKVINKPILIKNGLDNNYFRFHNFNSRKDKYFNFFTKLLSDLIFHPSCAVNAVINIFKHYPSPKYGIADYLDIRRFFGSRLDIIHSPFSTPKAINKVYQLSKALKIPYTLSFRAHDIYEGNNLKESTKSLIKIMEASQIMTISAYNKSYLESAFNISKNIEIIHSTIDPTFFKPANVPKSNNSIISVCGLHEQKGLIYLFKACHILSQKNVDYTCTIIGEGPEKANYEKLIYDLNIPNINFIDYLAYDKVKVKLNQSTVFVLPCIIASDGKRDILANSLKEAMSMELPVITSNIYGIEELLDNDISGILVPPQNPGALADAIEKVFTNPEYRIKMGIRGRIKIKQDFNIINEIKKLELIFNDKVNHSYNASIKEDSRINNVKQKELTL